MGVVLVGFVPFAGFLTPLAGVQFGKGHVALEGVVYFSQVHGVGGGQGLLVDFAAPNDEDFLVEVRAISRAWGTEAAVSQPAARQSAWRVTTMLRRFGRARPMLS